MKYQNMFERKQLSRKGFDGVSTMTAGWNTPKNVLNRWPSLKAHHCNWATTGVSGNSRSRPFPRIKASDSRSRIMGMDFFIPFPLLNFGNAFSPFPSCSRILGRAFLIPYRCWILGMSFFLLFSHRSQICHFTDGNHNRNWNIVRGIRFPMISAFSTFLRTGHTLRR